MKEVRLENISKTYGREETIRNLTLTVEKGEMVSLLGPSGCGKTTTLKLIAGLLEADYGRIFIDGKSVGHLPTQRRGAVIVFQEPRLFPHMTVAGNVEFGLRMQGMPKSLRRKKVQEMLKFVGLKEHSEKYPWQISGGEKQRVAIARGLIVSPKVLMLDEPFSNLDQRLKEEMRSFVVDIQRKLKITTILVTHDKEDALITSSKIGVMFNGELKQYGTPEELYETPNSVEVARFFGEINEIPINSMADEMIHTPLGKFRKEGPLKTVNETTAKLLLRPEALVLSDKVKQSETGNQRGIPGTITNRTYAGEKTYYRVEVEDHLLYASVIGKGSWQRGDGVVVSVMGEQLIVCNER